MFALHRRGVRDCRHCGDDDLRRRLHGPRQAGCRCLDVSIATCRSVLQLAPRNPPSKFTLQPGVSAVVVQYLGVKSGATSSMQYNYVAAGLRCCLTRQCSCNKRAAICYAATAFLRCNAANERFAIHLDVAKVACVARRCAGKRVEILCVAMGCI